MIVRAARVAVLLSLSSVSIGAQTVEYAAGTTRYRVSTATKGSQSSPMGNNDFEVGVRQLITVSLAKQAKDTMIATVTLDSITLSGAAAQADVTTLTGARFLSWVSPTGRVYSTKAPEGSNPVLAQVTESIARFLPSFRATLKPGTTWSDTTTGMVTQQGMQVDRTIISHFTVGRDTTIGGTAAHRIARVTSVKAAGTGSAQGTPISMESVSNSQSSIYLSTRGVYLGGTTDDDINLKIIIPAQSAEITMKQTGRTTIDAIR